MNIQKFSLSHLVHRKKQLCMKCFQSIGNCFSMGTTIYLDFYHKQVFTYSEKVYYPCIFP